MIPALPTQLRIAEGHRRELLGRARDLRRLRDARAAAAAARSATRSARRWTRVPLVRRWVRG